MKLIFCMQINLKDSYKFISTLRTSKLPTRWFYHYEWAWTSILKLLKVTSLQHLHHIAKTNLGMEFFFFLHGNKRQSLYKLALSFLKEATRHVQITQNRKLVTFLQYIKKKLLQLLLCSTMMQNIQIFYVGPVMFVVTCFGWNHFCKSSKM